MSKSLQGVQKDGNKFKQLQLSFEYMLWNLQKFEILKFVWPMIDSARSRKTLDVLLSIYCSRLCQKLLWELPLGPWTF